MNKVIILKTRPRLRESAARLLRKPLALALAGMCWTAVHAQPAAESQTGGAAPVMFNPALLPDGARGVDLTRFERGNLTEPGTYSVDLLLNDRWMARESVSFVGGDATRSAQPCFSTRLLVLMNVNLDQAGVKTPAEGVCQPLAEIVPGAFAVFDMSRQELSVGIAQIYLRRSARGYVPPELWDNGVTSGVLNYTTNFYTNRSNGATNDQAYAGLDAALSLGSWTLRQRSALSWRHSAYGSKQEWQNISTYANRAVPGLRSMLTVGDASTSGQVFDSVAFRGIR